MTTIGLLEVTFQGRNKAAFSGQQNSNKAIEMTCNGCFSLLFIQKAQAFPNMQLIQEKKKS